jgi:thymidylate kinase
MQNEKISNQTSKIIIFEGVDMCGKTHIAQALSKILLIPYFKGRKEHSRFFEQSREKSYIEAFFLIDFLSQTGYSAIIDRFHASEAVYSLVYRRLYYAEKLNAIDLLLTKLSAVTIYCYKDNIVSFYDELIERKKLKELKDEYEKYIKTTNMPVLRLNTESEDLDSQVETIIRWLNKLE